MAEQKIKYNELFDVQSIEQGLEQLSRSIAEAIAKGYKDAEKLKANVQKASPSTKSGQEQLKKEAAAINQLTREQKELLEQQTRLNTVKAQFRKEVKQDIALEGAEKGSIVALRAELSRLTAQYNNAGAAQRKQLQPQIKKTSDELKKLEKAVGDNRRNVGNYQGALKNLGKQFLLAAGLTGGMTMALRGLFNVIKGGFKTTWEFETSMSSVKAISRATGDEFNELKANAIALGGATKFTASEVAGLQKEYAKLGFTVGEILRITSATLDLAAATGSDLSQAASIAGATLRQFGLDATQMQRVVDVMTLSFSSSALDINKFETAMQNAGPVASAVGETIESTSAKLSVLANNGLDASISGTSLRNIFLELEKRGLTWDQAMTKIAGSQNKASTSLELFGKRGAVAGLILAENTVQIEELDAAYQNADGTAKEMAATMLDNVQGSMTILKSSWEGLTLRTNQSSGALKFFIDDLSLLVKAINSKGKPAIDSLFDSRKIETFQDRFSVYTDAGMGYLKAMSMARGNSNKKTQEFYDTISAGLNEQRNKELKVEADRLKIEAKKKADQEAAIAAKQAEVDRIAAIEEKAKKVREEAESKEKQRINAILTAREQEFRAFNTESAKKQKDEINEYIKDSDTKLATDKLVAVAAQYVDEENMARAHQEVLTEIELEAQIERRQQSAETAQKTLEYLQQGTEAFASIFEAAKQRELSAAGDNAEKRAEIEKKYFKKQQALNTALAIIEGAKGIAKAVAYSPVTFGLPWSAFVAATTAAQVATIASQKFAKGGFGVLGGHVHSEGGTMIPGVGEAEKGEAVGIISRRATQRYGADMLEGVFKSIENGTFTDIWGRANAQIINVISPSDPFTKKMYEHMLNTPSYYQDSQGNWVEILRGERRVIRRG